MIYVTHDQVEAMTLADRIVVMRAGRIEQQGAPEALYSDPDNLFVAGFLGTPRMNLLPARVTKWDGAWAMTKVPALGFDALPVRLRDPGQEPLQEVVLGLRPEAFRPQGSEGNTVRLVAEVVENLGASRYLYTEGARGAAVVAEVPRGSALRPGEAIDLTVPPESGFLFAPEGRRL
jgi:ABC-type sugar transport system ATPase subunit